MSGTSQTGPTTAKFQQSTYNTLKKELTDALKKIGNYETSRDLPSEPATREERIRTYTREVTGYYNNFLSYINLFYNTFELQSKFRLNEEVEKLKLKARKALNILKLDIELPESLEKFDINTIRELDSINTNTQKTAGASSLLTVQNQENSDLDDNFDSQQNSGSQENITLVGDSTLQSQQQQIIPDPPENRSHLNNNNTQNNNNQNLAMAQLTPGDILTGIPDFDPKSQDNVKKFIAQVDLMHVLAPNSGEIILAIARAKLITANKLSSIDDKTWAQIKTDIQSKYRMQMSYEMAQEKLLSVQQGPKEGHDAYAKKVRELLDALNAATTNDDANIQKSNRDWNENLAVRKFKQNIYDKELRTMAITAEHTTLAEAIAHASTKFEQLQASNVSKGEQDKKNTERKEPEGEKQNKNTHKQSNFKYNKNKNEYQNKSKNNSSQCTYCKKLNHQSDQCFFRPGGPGANKSNENESKSSNIAAAVAQPTGQPEATATTSSTLPMQSNSINLQPYHYLNLN